MPSITDSIGRVLGDRYRLVTALGTGASAHVYLADDVSLHRRVAIKVLHPALAGDTRLPQALPGRGPGRGRPQPSQHPPGLRLGRGGRRALPGPRVSWPAAACARSSTPGSSSRRNRPCRWGSRPPPVSTTPTAADWSTGTSSRPTSSSTPTGASASPTSAWPGPWPRRRGPSRTGPSWARPATPPPNRSRDGCSTGRPTSTPWPWCSTKAVTGEAPFIGDTTVATLMARVGALLPEHEALGPLNDVLVWAAAPEPSERYDAAQLGLRLQALAVALPEPEPLPLVDAVPIDEVGEVDNAMIRVARRRAAGGERSEVTELGAPDPSVRCRGGTKRLPTAIGGTVSAPRGEAPVAVDRAALPWWWPPSSPPGWFLAVQQRGLHPQPPRPLAGRQVGGPGRAGRAQRPLHRPHHRPPPTASPSAPVCILSQQPDPACRRHHRSPPSRARPSTWWSRPGPRR